MAYGTIKEYKSLVIENPVSERNHNMDSIVTNDMQIILKVLFVYLQFGLINLCMHVLFGIEV